MQVLRQLVRAIASEVGRDELVLLLGLVMVAAGLYDVWRPGSLIVPGAILVWQALPSRAVFISRPPLLKKGDD